MKLVGVQMCVKPLSVLVKRLIGSRKMQPMYINGSVTLTTKHHSPVFIYYIR